MSTTGKIIWDDKPLRSAMLDSTDKLVDAAQPHVATLAKTATVGAITAVVIGGGTASKTLVAAQCPALYPCAENIINIATGPAIAYAQKTALPLVNAGVQNAMEAAKESSHKSTDACFDFFSRNISVEKNKQ